MRRLKSEISRQKWVSRRQIPPCRRCLVHARCLRPHVSDQPTSSLPHVEEVASLCFAYVPRLRPRSQLATSAISDRMPHVIGPRKLNLQPSSGERFLSQPHCELRNLRATQLTYEESTLWSRGSSLCLQSSARKFPPCSYPTATARGLFTL